MLKPPAKTVRKSRIQAKNQAAILKAALEVFSAYGYRGATVDQIAARAGFSKPNLLYYFRRKEEIYRAVLENTLDEWLKPLRVMDVAGDPAEELTRYISEKLDLSFSQPLASRLFANEILQGAPHVKRFLKGPLARLVAEKKAVMNQWIKDGRIEPIDPPHFIFAIWAVTQHYADFAVQVEAVMRGKPPRAATKKAVLQLLLHGIIKKDR